MKAAGAVVVATVLGAALLIQATAFRQNKSITFDETYFLSCALQTVRDGRLDPRIAAEGIAPLPIMLSYLLPLSFSGGEDRPEPWRGQVQDARLIAGPRLANSIVVGLPLLVLVAGWLYWRKGVSAAAAGAGLIAFCPSLVAHVSLAGTDACFALFGTLALGAIAWHFHRPSPWRFGLMALAIAAGMAAKYSGVFLLPVVAVMYVVHTSGRLADQSRVPWMKRCRRAALGGALLVLLITIFWWGLHLFSFTGPLKNYPLEKTPDSSPWVQMLGRGPVATEVMRVAHEKLRRPAPLAGVLFQYLHNRRGHSAFLMGDQSETGWWYYFPFAFLVKSTPVELFLCAALVVLVARTLPAPWRAFKALDTQVQSLFIGAAVFSLLVMSARINIGQRYILLLYPLLVLLAVDRLWERILRWPKLGAWCAAALIAAQAASCLSVAPHYLAYFNRAAGGPERGWHLLVDSSIDWGQDLPGLAREIERRDRRRVALVYFGTAVPRAYGVEADNVPALKLPLDEYDTLAISVTPLQGLYVLGDDPFREFRSLRPIGRAGYSILIFDLAEPPGLDAFRAALSRYRRCQD